MSLEFVSTMSLEFIVNYVLDWFTSLPSFRPCRSALTLGKPIAISSGTSKAAPRICMRTRLTFVVIGTGWMGIFLGHVETS